MYSEITANKRRTWFLIIVFMMIVLSLGWFIDRAYGSGFGTAGIVYAGVIAIMMTLISYYQGDRIALASSGAIPINKEGNLALFRMVENIAITAGIPTPKVYLINDAAINAFATGRDPAHASIAVTTGAVTKLSKEELEGVLAHELSHVRNYDIRVMTIVIVLVGTVALLSNGMMRIGFLGGNRRRDNDQGGNGILMIVGLVLMLLSPLIAKLIQLAISRRREYLADASGALLTRYPQGLADALQKIANDRLPTQHASAAIAHLYIADPFDGSKKFMSNLFSTHPPIEDRIAKLRAMGT